MAGKGSAADKAARAAKAAEKKKAEEEKKKAAEQAKKTKGRTTINSGGLGRFLNNSLNSLRGSKNNLAARGESPAQQTSEQVQPQQNDQHLEVPLADPQTSSTPFGSPSGGRRSPAGILAENSSVLINSSQENTIDRHDESVDQLVLSNPTKENIPTMISSLRDRIETFGLDFRQEVDWKDKFEIEGEKLANKLNALLSACTNLQMEDQCIEVYELKDNLEINLHNLRKFAAQERSTPAHTLIAGARLTPNARDQVFVAGRNLMRSPTPQTRQLPPTTNAQTVARNRSPGIVAAATAHTSNTPQGITALPSTASQLPEGATAQTADLGNQSDVVIADHMTALNNKFTDLQGQVLTAQNNLGLLSEAVDTKASAEEVANLKTEVAQMREFLKACNIPSLKPLLDRLTQSTEDLNKTQTRDQTLLRHVQKDVNMMRGHVDQVRTVQERLNAAQQNINSDIKLLNEISGADFVPRMTPNRRVNFQDQGQGAGNMGLSMNAHYQQTQNETVQQHQAHPSQQRVSYPVTGSGDPTAQLDQARYMRSNHRMNIMPNNTELPGMFNRTGQPYTATTTTTSTTMTGLTGVRSLHNPSIVVTPAPSTRNQFPGAPHHGLRVEHEGSPYSQGSGYSAESVESTYTGNDRAAWLFNSANELVGRLEPSLDSPELTKAVVVGLHKSKLISVENDRKDLLHLLDKYIDDRSQPTDNRLVKHARSAASSAKNWSNGIRDKYNALECANKDFDEKLFSSLPKFTESSEMSIFEFLKKFEAYTLSRGDEHKRANLLFNEYLDRDVQETVMQYKSDYSRMKMCLIETYGKVRRITANIFNRLLSENIPADDASENVVYRYIKKLNCALQGIVEMTKEPNIPKQSLEEHIYSVEFLSQLKEFLPRYQKFEYMKELRREGVNHKEIYGKRAFEIYVVTVSEYFSLLEGSVSSEKSKISWKRPQAEKQKQKQVKSPPKKSYAAVAGTVSDTDESGADSPRRSAHYTEKPKKQQKQNKPAKSGSSPKPKPAQAKTQKQATGSYKFPCGLHNGDHELGECEEFFKTAPSQRKWKMKKLTCTNCMGPKENCRGECKKSIPKELICEECLQFARHHKWIPQNVLFCTFKSHPKYDKKDVTDALKKYLKGYDSAKMSPIMVFAAHAQVTTYQCEKHSSPCDCKPRKTKTSKPIENAPVPAFDTYSGKLCKTKNGQISKESPEDVIYVTQIININGRDVLVFYDRGSNHNLVEGELAEELKLKVISDKPSTCGTLGKGRLVSEYGSYSLCLGSEEGKFFEITAQAFNLGIDHPYCNLDQINAEVTQSKQLPADAILPKFLGGLKVGILIGLKSPALEPQLLFQLPCGLGVYKSVLKDKFGSVYCFGGPHNLFSKVSKDKKLAANFSTLQTYFTQVRSSHQSAFYPALSKALTEEFDEIAPGLVIPKDRSPQTSFVTQSGSVIEPTPLGDDDLMQMGYSVSQSHRFREDQETGCIHPGAKARCSCPSKIRVFKASVPIAKKKVYLDAPDETLIEDTRCMECRRCKICAKSVKEQVMSLNERAEQAAIESSVHFEKDAKRVVVELPFTKDPVTFLSKRHQGNSNYGQALKIYQAQCRKNDATKEGMRKTHKDLVEKGFMSKLSDLPPEGREIIENAPFTHAMPWRAVFKEDSLTTPVRMVVDASCTGINEILAKGTNGINSIFDIIIRSRCSKYIWAADISKLYNQLHLSPSSYPYSLFLYHPSLEVGTKPDIYVLTRAWYGITSTGNQSAEALSQVVNSVKDVFPKAQKVIDTSLYVDDALSGSNNEEDMNNEIDQVSSALETGGFRFKFICKSGKPPPQEASADGKSIKILGYLWEPEEDKLGLGFSEINFNRKRRGSKKPNPFPVKNPNDLSKLLRGRSITRRIVFSKIGEIYDPTGILEPYKVQLKLDNSKLNGLEWDVPVSQEQQKLWENRFQEFLELPKFRAGRCLVPKDAVNPDKIRLLCLSDAAEEAGGAAVYAGWKLRDGSYSCQLLTARSKLLNQTIPRNELESVKIMTELALDVKKALGDRVEEILYFTDSTVAMCWSHSVTKRLRLYTLHRVLDIRANIAGRENLLEASLPLYHIDGKNNIADLLTKKHSITPLDLTEGTPWQDGLPWMREPFDKMTVTCYDELTVKASDESMVDQECFPTPYLTGLMAQVSDTCREEEECVFDNEIEDDDHASPPVTVYQTQKKVPNPLDHLKLRYYGYHKSLRLLSVLIKFASMKTHKYHVQKGVSEREMCLYCRATKICSPKSMKFSVIYQQYALEYLLRRESEHLKQTLPQTKLKYYTEINGILYYHSRLSEESEIKSADIDVEVFYDSVHIKSLLPVVSAKCDLFLVYAIHVHENIRPHGGVEAIFSEILTTMYPIDNPRDVVKMIKKKCPRCRLISRKTLELKVMNHPDVRTTLTPPFFNVMIDTVYGFKCQSFKGARGKTTKMYGLIIVCLLTGAVNILGMQGLETADVVQALERHGFRHGFPARAFVDNGTQLICLQRAEFDIRDFQLRVQTDLGLEVIVSTPKSHEERGRVEAKVKALRDMMRKLAVSEDTAMTALQWETLFAKISSMINDLPLAKSSTSNVSDLGWNLLTPNRLLLGRNQNRSLEGSVRIENSGNLDRLLQKNNKILSTWYNLFSQKIHHLIPRPKKWTKDDPIQVGDVVLFIYNDNPNMDKDVWRLGRVERIIKPTQVEIKFPFKVLDNGKSKMKTLIRSPRDISIIQGVDELSNYAGEQGQ